MKQVIFDIETDDLNATRIWCIVCKDVDSGVLSTFAEGSYDSFVEYAKGVDRWIGHNARSFDARVINRLISPCIQLDKVIDTAVVSRLVNFSNPGGHSLANLSRQSGSHKDKFDDWSAFTLEMLSYCIQDVEATLQVYNRFKKYIDDPAWALSIKVEHEIEDVCYQMNQDGFAFDVVGARMMLDDIRQRMLTLEASFQEAWPRELVEAGRIKYRFTKDGDLFANVKSSMNALPAYRIEGDELVQLDWREFNPGSPKQRVEKLNEAGWRPTERTDTHYEFHRDAGPGKPWRKSTLTVEEYEEKKTYFQTYGWTVSDENLTTLPETAPVAAKALTQWLTLDGRKKALEERLTAAEGDGRIHAKFWHIGAWTHRMSHSNPNVANVSSPFHLDVVSPVDEIKAEYDAKMREQFHVDEGFLVGTDADGIQLRILAHYLRNDDYVHAIVSGNKKEGTDIHSLNRKSLSLGHIVRDDAKTFIYAWLLGAGGEKVGRILRCTLPVAKASVSSFVEKTKGLKELKSGRIRRDASRGYFEGLDGRKVVNNSEYLMLAGYLQNGEAVIMKHANILWRGWADEAKIRYNQVNFVHDEWQTQVRDSYDAAVELGRLQCKSLEEVGRRLNVYCPLAGETKIGSNWLETH